MDNTEQAHGIAAGELRQLVEQAERLEQEKAEISEQIKEVMNEARARGYEPKVIRKILALRKRDADDIAEEDAIMDMYMAALGMV